MHSNFRMITKDYQQVLSMYFAIHEINKNIKLLPNTTLQLEIFQDSFLAHFAIQNILNFLFLKQGNALNYNCVRRMKSKLRNVIGALTSHSAVHIAYILNSYKIPQVREHFHSTVCSCEMISLSKLNCIFCPILNSYFNVLFF